jgi:hypothetical protein
MRDIHEAFLGQRFGIAGDVLSLITYFCTGHVKLLDGSAFMRKAALQRLQACQRDEQLPQYIESCIFERMVQLLDDETDPGVRAELYTCICSFSKSAICRPHLRACGVMKALQRSAETEAEDGLLQRCRECLEQWA